MAIPRFAARARKALPLVVGCAVIATAGAFGIDRFLVARQRQALAAQRPAPDRSLLPTPSAEGWRPTLFAVGTPAPPFDLTDVRTGRRAGLVEHRGKRPVVLLLGSFGCNVFSGQLDEVIRLYERCRDRAAFLFVAIKDAGHPLPEMALAEGERRDLTDPETQLCYVRKGLELYQVPFPCVLDEYGEVERAYDAFPQRLLVIGADGNIIFDAGWGALGGPSAWDLTKVELCLRQSRTE